MPDGLLAIDKPAGWTSHDVVARVRKALKTKRAGHAGTLDPDATGVLVIAVGVATRLLPHLPLEPKVYIARACFGTATTSEDASGEVVQEADASALTEDALRAVLPRFLGEIDQIPPMVSAVHHEGKRLYELARQGITVERESRRVTIHAIELSDFTPGERAYATLAVTCGGGTYIRTLCKDIGEALGLPAHMASLVRTAVGPFVKENAVPVEALNEPETVTLVAMEDALGVPKVVVSDEDAERVKRGMTIADPHPPAPSPASGQEGEISETPLFPLAGEGQGVRVLLYRERLLALARTTPEEGLLHPFKVFATDDPTV